LVEYGAIYEHDFHSAADSDWIQFAVEAGKSYRIEAQLPSGSLADLAMELHDTCTPETLGNWDEEYSHGVRYKFTATQTGQYFVRFFNVVPVITSTK